MLSHTFMPDISVIVPALNEEKYIEACLKSVVSQKTDLNYELIVVDSNSVDKTKEIAERYADKTINLKKKGIWRARNAGAKKSRSKFLCFIDADTRLPKNYLSSVYPVIEGDKTISALSCAFKFDRRTYALKLVEKICNNYLSLRGLAGKGEILGFNNVIRKNHFNKLGGFPNEPLEDGALAIRMRKIGRVVYLNEPRVITSARRLEGMGILKSTFYYASLSVATDLPISKLKKVFNYKSIR